MNIWLAEQKVILNRRVYKSHWRNKDDQYWFARLLEEVAELGMALQNEHKHEPEVEITQIAGICTNWLEKREEFNEPSAVDVLDVQEGDPVHAIHDGVVLVDHDESGYGKHVLVRHEPEPFPFVDMDVSEMSVVELKAYLEMKAKEDTQPVKVMDWMKEW